MSFGFEYTPTRMMSQPLLTFESVGAIWLFINAVVIFQPADGTYVVVQFITLAPDEHEHFDLR